MNHLVISSTNSGKIAEISALVSDLSIQVYSFQQFFGYPLAVEEDGATYSENAIKKVAQSPDRSDCVYLADDSGLSVAALNGRPGLYSARYAQGSAVQGCHRLLEEMQGVSDRMAYFTCAIALKFPGGAIKVVEGKMSGNIGDQLVGENGFGFDPIFIPTGYSQTLAQLDGAEKNRISHRFYALSQARALIVEHLACI